MKKFFLILCATLCLLTSCGSPDANKINDKELTVYNLDVQVDCQKKEIQAQEDVCYVNGSEAVLDKVKFHLYPNAFKRKNSSLSVVSEYNFDTAYPNGFDSGYIDILSVANNNGEELRYEICGEEENILCVYLNNKIYPTEKADIHIDFFVKIPNIIHRFGYGENTINVGNFYPIACVYENGDFVCDGYHYNGDPFYSEMANYKATIKYDSTYILSASGEEDTKTKDGKKISKIQTNRIRDFSFILSNKFLTKTAYEETTKTNCTYYYYSDENPEQTLELIKQSLCTFSELIGEYPYSTLNVAQSNFLHGGMEYPLLVFISDAEMKRQDYYRVIVHEIAHQWFYNLIGNNEYSEAWLDEGLTEYATMLFFEQNEQYGINYEQSIGNMLSSYQMFVDVYTDVFGELDTSMDRALNEFKSEPEYTYCVYIKGVLMLDNLRSLIGDSSFFLGLKNYYNDNVYGIARQDNFISAFQKASNKDISKIIKSWIDGTVILQKAS